MTGVRALVAHSGGPTAVLNASLAGIVERARKETGIASLLGARFGIEGILAEDFVDLGALPSARLAAIAASPSSAIGTSRRALTSADVERVIHVCRARDIRWLFYTGGNGSMGTATSIATAARDAGHPLQVIGVPKTIDNDLVATDHAPGYASAARYAACAVRDIGSDNRALPGVVQVIEVLGRNTGWIAAATTLARRQASDAPHLVYVPERALSLQRLFDDVQHVYDRYRRCVVVVCEGQHDETGQPFGADVRMSSRGPLATNLAHHLAGLITDALHLKARGEKPGLVGRVSAAFRSETDWQEAKLCGQAAVDAARDGAAGVMVTLERQPGPAYATTTGLVPLDRVAGAERSLPLDWIDGRGGEVAPAFLDYVRPLVGEIDAYDTLV